MHDSFTNQYLINHYIYRHYRRDFFLCCKYSLLNIIDKTILFIYIFSACRLRWNWSNCGRHVRHRHRTITSEIRSTITFGRFNELSFVIEWRCTMFKFKCALHTRPEGKLKHILFMLCVWAIKRLNSFNKTFQISRNDPCEICLCVDGEIFCWWKKCGKCALNIVVAYPREKLTFM